MSDLFNALFGSNNSKPDNSKEVIEYKYKRDTAKEEEKSDLLNKSTLLHIRETSRPHETFEKIEPLVEERAPVKNVKKINEDIYVKNVNSEQMTAYNPEDVLTKATEYFGGDEMVANVWMNKYALRDGSGNIYELTPDDMHLRLSREFARIEKKYPNPLDEIKINMLLKHFRYIVPQGSPMFGIGNDFQIASLSNCFVIGNTGNSDSYGGIMKIDEEQVQLMKRRGGVGHDLSHIRPEGSLVNNSALTSTGSFLLWKDIQIQRVK